MSKSANTNVNMALITLQVVLLVLVWSGAVEWSVAIITPVVFCIGWNIPDLLDRT